MPIASLYPPSAFFGERTLIPMYFYFFPHCCHVLYYTHACLLTTLTHPSDTEGLRSHAVHRIMPL